MDQTHWLLSLDSENNSSNGCWIWKITIGDFTAGVSFQYYTNPLTGSSSKEREQIFPVGRVIIIQKDKKQGRCQSIFRSGRSEIQELEPIESRGAATGRSSRALRDQDWATDLHKEETLSVHISIDKYESLERGSSGLEPGTQWGAVTVTACEFNVERKIIHRDSDAEIDDFKQQLLRREPIEPKRWNSLDNKERNGLNTRTRSKKNRETKM